MAFCGNCGLQLPPHASACPRCGTATDPRLAIDDSNPNDPTIAVLPTSGATIQSTPTPPPATQPTYISQPGVTTPNNSQANAPTYITPLPPVTPASNHSPYPSNSGFPPPPPVSGANYASGVNYEPTAISGANYQAPGISSPGYPPPGGVVYQPIEQGYAPAPRQRKSRSGMVALVLFLVALLFVGGALGIFFAKREGLLFGSATPTPAPTSTSAAVSTQTVAPTQTPGSTPTYTPTATASVTQQAQTLLQNYYSDINNKDYQDAYAMLGSQMQANQQSYTNYANGYSNTQQDTINITNTTQNSDGTVRLDVTLTALLTDGSTQNYTGYYIIGPQNGSLKILSGKLQQS